MEEDRLEMAYQSSGVKMDITNYVKTKLGVGSEEDQKEQTSPRDEDDIEQQVRKKGVLSIGRGDKRVEFISFLGIGLVFCRGEWPGVIACAFFPFPNLGTHFFRSLWCVKFEKDP